MFSSRFICLSICLVAFCESVVYGFSFPYYSLRLEQQGVSSTLIGLHAAAGTLGVLSCGRVFPWLIARLGYRDATGASFALSLGALGASLFFDSLPASFALRVLLGIGFAGIWVCTEAWLNHTVDDRHRGKVNASFQALYSLGFFLGPVATYATGFDGPAPIVFMAGLMATGVIVVRLVADGPLAAGTGHEASPRSVIRSAHGILTVSLLIGLSETAIFALLPVYGTRQGLSTELAVSLLVAYSAGEIAIALPIGWLADRTDRDKLLTVCALVAAVAVVSLLTIGGSKAGAWAVTAVAGGLVASLHNIALILLGERYRGAALPVVSTAFSMAYALGSAGGSAAGGLAMDWMGAAGLPLFVGASLLCFGLCRLRTLRRPAFTSVAP